MKSLNMNCVTLVILVVVLVLVIICCMNKSNEGFTEDTLMNSPFYNLNNMCVPSSFKSPRKLRKYYCDKYNMNSVNERHCPSKYKCKLNRGQRKNLADWLSIINKKCDEGVDGMFINGKYVTKNKPRITNPYFLTPDIINNIAGKIDSINYNWKEGCCSIENECL
jgi:hypothetical protein